MTFPKRSWISISPKPIQFNCYVLYKYKFPDPFRFKVIFVFPSDLRRSTTGLLFWKSLWIGLVPEFGSLRRKMSQPSVEPWVKRTGVLSTSTCKRLISPGTCCWGVWGSDTSTSKRRWRPFPPLVSRMNGNCALSFYSFLPVVLWIVTFWEFLKPNIKA